MIAKSRQARRAGERQSRHRDSSVVDVQSQIWGSTDSPAWMPKSKTESLGVNVIEIEGLLFPGFGLNLNY